MWQERKYWENVIFTVLPESGARGIVIKMERVHRLCIKNMLIKVQVNHFDTFPEILPRRLC